MTYKPKIQHQQTVRFERAELQALARRERRNAWWTQKGEALLRYAVAGAIVGLVFVVLFRAYQWR